MIRNNAYIFHRENFPNKKIGVHKKFTIDMITELMILDHRYYKQRTDLPDDATINYLSIEDGDTASYAGISSRTISESMD